MFRYIVKNILRFYTLSNPPTWNNKRNKIHEFNQAHISLDINGLLNVLLWPAIPYHSTPCRRPPLKLTQGHIMGGHLQSGHPLVVFHPLGYPMPCGFEFNISGHMYNQRSLLHVGKKAACDQSLNDLWNDRKSWKNNQSSLYCLKLRIRLTMSWLYSFNSNSVETRFLRK
jgi:hypothetical protein